MFSTRCFKRGAAATPFARGSFVKAILVLAVLVTLVSVAAFGLNASSHAAPSAATVESIEPYEIPTEPWEEVSAANGSEGALNEGGDEGGTASDSLDFEPLPHTKATFKKENTTEEASKKPIDPFDGVSLERLFQKSKPVIQGKDGVRVVLALLVVLGLVWAFFKWVFPRILPLLVKEQTPYIKPIRSKVSPRNERLSQAVGNSPSEPRPYEVLRSFPVHKHTRIELVSVWERYLLVGATREGSVSLGEVHPPNPNASQSQSWFEPTRTPQGEPISDVLQRHPAILQACLDCVTEQVFPPMVSSVVPSAPLPEQSLSQWSPSPPHVAASQAAPFAHPPYPQQPSYRQAHPSSADASLAVNSVSMNPEVLSVLNKYLPNPVPPTVIPQPEPLSQPVYPSPEPQPPVFDASPLTPLPKQASPSPTSQVIVQPSSQGNAQQAPSAIPYQPERKPIPIPSPRSVIQKEVTSALPLPPPPLVPPAPPPEPEFITVLDDYDDIF